MKTIKNNVPVFFVAIVLAVTLILGMCAGCNYQVVDVKYQFDYAILQLPSGEIIEGELQSWRDYDESDQIQVKIDGITYLVHSVNIALISKEPVPEEDG